MTASLLPLNSSKTEFLLIGLKQQISKIHDSSLTSTHSTRNVSFIFDEHLTFSDQISAIAKSCYYHICEICCIFAHTLTSKQPAPLPPPLFILNLTTVILSITTFQTVNLTGSNRSKTLLIVVLSRLLDPHISVYYSHYQISPLA